MIVPASGRTPESFQDITHQDAFPEDRNILTLTTLKGHKVLIHRVFREQFNVCVYPGIRNKALHIQTVCSGINILWLFY